ncbi:radical SAM protein [Halobacteriovorax marinus]|uniref:radical SAM protein n=1 Tax=Halobacteriovorax marinus TaxID=97084 RepID=UPI003A8F262D
MAELFLDGSKLINHISTVNKWKRGERIAPIHVEVSPSAGCNQRCNLCYVDYLGHKSKLLSEKILVSMVEDFSEIGVKSVLLAGEGEPTANPGVVPMIKRAHELGVDMAINSNAVLMTPEMSREILPGLTWARFTFQASNKALYDKIHLGGRNDFSRAINNVEAAVKIKKELGLNVTLGIQQILINENYRDVLETAKLAKSLGVDYYVVKRFSKHPNNDYDVPVDLYKQSLDLFDEAEKLSDDNFKVLVRWKNFTKDCDRNYKRCMGIPFITQVLADGKIYPCSQFFKDDRFSFGDLHKSSFKEIIFSDKAQEVAKRIENTVDVSKCMSFCRHHNTNMFVWDVMEDKKHKNFI